MANMTLSLAEECIRKAKLKAIKLGITVYIAVVDDGGMLVAYARMRERPTAIGERKTIAKARTAVNYRKDTQALMEEFINYPGNYFIIGMSAMYPDEFWGGPGGAPIIVDGEVIGGIGVSGSSQEDDHQCAIAGAQPKANLVSNRVRDKTVRVISPKKKTASRRART